MVGYPAGFRQKSSLISRSMMNQFKRHQKLINNENELGNGLKFKLCTLEGRLATQFIWAN
jgi:hypothetical protein